MRLFFLFFIAVAIVLDFFLGDDPCNHRTAQARVIVEHIVHASLVVYAQLFLGHTKFVDQAFINHTGAVLAQDDVALYAACALVGITGNDVHHIRVSLLDGLGKQAKLHTGFVGQIQPPKSVPR